MSQEQYSHKSQKSRKITQNEKRQFGCPCGKTYLSYPALFTHVKQKHEGHAPGQLIKPKKNENIKRGRPPIHPHEKTGAEDIQQLNLEVFFDDKIPKNLQFDFDEQFEYAPGTKNCLQIFSRFLNHYAIEYPRKNVLTCFILLMKKFITDKTFQKYCEENNAEEIIDFTNQLVKEFQNYSHKYPLSKQMLIDILWGFFAWLYKEKFTDHRLQKNTSDKKQQQITEK